MASVTATEGITGILYLSNPKLFTDFHNLYQDCYITDRFTLQKMWQQTQQCDI